jgi:hypothetical protein
MHQWLVAPTTDPAILKMEACKKGKEISLRELREWIVSGFAKLPHVIGCAREPVCVATGQLEQFLVSLCES